MPIRESLISLCFVLFLLSSVQGQESHDFVVVEELKPFWKIKSTDNDLVPYLGETEIDIIYFELIPARYHGGTLQIRAGEDHYLFVDNKIHLRFSSNSITYFDIDSLKELRPGIPFWFGIYSENLNPVEISTVIVNKGKRKYEVSDASSLSPMVRNVVNDNEFLVMTICLLGLLLILRASRYKLFVEYLSPRRAFSIRQKSDVLTSLSPVTGDHLFFEGLYSLLISFALTYPASQLHIWSEELGQLGLSRISQYGILTLSTFILMKLKWILISFVSTLFRVKQLSSVHYFTYFRLSLLIGLMGFGFSILIQPFVNVNVLDLSNMLGLLLMMLLFVRVMVIALMLNNKHSFRKLHLFFYLCTTELFPLAIFIKVFLK